MTIDLAIDYIRRRMLELGHGDLYHLRFRHYVLTPRQRISIDALDQLFILIEPVGNVNVESVFGMYDLTVDNSNELQYEHQGQIQLSNYTYRVQHVRFIQVIPIPVNSKKITDATLRGKI
jgi:hypothetical protein